MALGKSVLRRARKGRRLRGKRPTARKVKKGISAIKRARRRGTARAAKPRGRPRGVDRFGRPVARTGLRRGRGAARTSPVRGARGGGVAVTGARLGTSRPASLTGALGGFAGRAVTTGAKPAKPAKKRRKRRRSLARRGRR